MSNKEDILQLGKSQRFKLFKITIIIRYTYFYATITNVHTFLFSLFFYTFFIPRTIPSVQFSP